MASLSFGVQVTKRFKATIKLPSNALQKVEIEAENWNNAKQLLAMQYGKENVINVCQVN